MSGGLHAAAMSSSLSRMLMRNLAESAPAIRAAFSAAGPRNAACSVTRFSSTFEQRLCTLVRQQESSALYAGAPYKAAAAPCWEAAEAARAYMCNIAQCCHTTLVANASKASRHHNTACRTACSCKRAVGNQQAARPTTHAAARQAAEDKKSGVRVHIASRPSNSSKRAYSTASSSGSSQRSGHSSGWQYGGGRHEQGRSSYYSHVVACYGAMIVISLPALGKTLVVMCEGKASPPPAQARSKAASHDLDDYPSVTLTDLFSILDGEWMWLGVAIAVTLIWAWCQNFMPVAFATITTAVHNKEALDGPIFNFMRLQVTVMVLDSARHFMLSTLGERVRQRLRVRLFQAMLKQEIGFFDANSKGQLMSMMGEDVSRMQQAVTDNIAGTVMQLTTICQCAKMVLSISPYATMLVVAAVPVLSFASIFAQASSRARSKAAFESAREIAATASEILSNARTVQSFTAETMESERYAERMHKQYGLELEYRVFTGSAHLVFACVNMGLSVGGMYYGGRQVAQGKLKMEDLMLFMQYSFKIGNALGSLLNIIHEQQRALMSASKVKEMRVVKRCNMNCRWNMQCGMRM